jgi:hypothetical protein
MVKKSKNKFKNIKINLNISNRLLYSIIAVLVIVGIGAFVYAVTPNPGHTANEIEGVCKSNGEGCTNVKDSRFTINSQGELCFNVQTVCTTQNTPCTATIYPIINDEGLCSLTLSQQNARCKEECSAHVACNGDLLPAPCTKGTSIYYNDGVRISCSQTTPVNTLSCKCQNNPSQNYKKEVSGSETQQRCI